MKKSINTAKKGVVLVFTTIILFVATSIVAVLSTFVIVARNTKIEFEYTSRTQIALKNKAYEVFGSWFLSLSNINNTYTVTDEDTTVLISQADLQAYNVNFVGAMEFTFGKDDYIANTNFYQYKIAFNNLPEYQENKKSFREVSILTTIKCPSGSLNDKSKYYIAEMRYF